jgi:Tfp pilus assembly protein PilZ
MYEHKKREQRKGIRKKLMAFTAVYDSNQRILLGYVMNLSLLGIMVVGEKTVEINEDRLLKIEFPNSLPDLASTQITIPARVAWCRQDESPGYFNIGFEFTEVTPERTKIFQAIIDRYQFRQDIPR